MKVKFSALLLAVFFPLFLLACKTISAYSPPSTATPVPFYDYVYEHGFSNSRLSLYIYQIRSDCTEELLGVIDHSKLKGRNLKIPPNTSLVLRSVRTTTPIIGGGNIRRSFPLHFKLEPTRDYKFTYQEGLHSVQLILWTKSAQDKKWVVYPRVSKDCTLRP